MPIISYNRSQGPKVKQSRGASEARDDGINPVGRVEGRALLRRLFTLLFAGLNRMTMVRLESSSVLPRVQSQGSTQMMDEDYSDRARPSTLPAIMDGGGGRGSGCHGHRLSHFPDEGNQFARDSRNGDLHGFSAHGQAAIAAIEAHLRFPGDGAHGFAGPVIKIDLWRALRGEGGDRPKPLESECGALRDRRSW